jgi:altronate dehydratase
MSESGFYFMDSPGNDLESIAGQVAAGCNMILFATGNGSITNFPFVPTIKIMTTTRRFELVRHEMDVNAGRYLDGESLEDLGREAFDYMLRIASGQPSAGEKAGHSQVQLWREWRLNPNRGNSRSDGVSSKVEKPAIRRRDELRESQFIQENTMKIRDSRSSSLRISSEHDIHEQTQTEIPATPLSQHIALAEQIVRPTRMPRYALVLPTSLCSGQIAIAIADKLNRLTARDFDRAVALPHTEGCGNSGGESEQIFMRTMAGYLAHPFVARALLLEHGCEKTHNDAFRNILRELGLPESRYGFTSIQLDGGIERVTAKSLDWFQKQNGDYPIAGPFSLGLYGREIPNRVREAFEVVRSALLNAGGSVVAPEEIGGGQPIGYGERFLERGQYLMECPTDDSLEIITGIAATGVQVIIIFEPQAVLPANPIVPTISISTHQNGADLIIDDSFAANVLAEKLLRLILDVRQDRRTLVAQKSGNVAFQITRGYEGISL